MTGMDPHLHKRLKSTLLQSGWFEDDRDLRSVFVDARISPWRDGLPHASSPAMRVNLVISFLCDQYNAAEENALLLLLQVLRDQTSPDDARYQELTALYDEFSHTSLDLTTLKYEPGPAWWHYVRRHPWLFYPAVGLVVLAFGIFVFAAILGMGADIGSARQQFQAWGWLPTATSPPTATPTQTATVTPIPTATPLPFAAEASDEILIVVASFHRSEGVVDTEAHYEIQHAIQKAAEDLSFAQLRVEVEPTSLRADDRTGAEALGKRYNASIIIWGADTGVRVTVNYLNLKERPFHAAEVEISETARTQLAAPDAYASFITEDLPQQVAFLSLFAIGQSYNQAERIEDAIATIEKGIETLGPAPEPLTGVAEAYWVLAALYHFEPVQNYERALTYYDKVVALEPYFVQYAYTNRGFLRSEMGDVTGAMADLQQDGSLDPDSTEYYTLRGFLYLKAGDFVNAALDYNRAIALDPDNISANENGFKLLVVLQPKLASGDLDYEMPDFEQAVPIDSDNAPAYRMRANLRSLLGDLEGALPDYDKAIALNNEDTRLYYNRGLIRYQFGDLENAVQDYTVVVEREPDWIFVHNKLCWTYALLQQPALAMPYCNAAVEGAEGTTRIGYQDSRGIAYALFGDYEAAIADFQALVDWLEQQPGTALEAILAKRRAWIAALEAGENPFTSEVLAELQNE